jgi:hypothetical protein
LVQFDAKGIGGVKFSGISDEDLREVGVNPSFYGLIGMGKGIPRNLSRDAQMIKSGRGCPQTDLYISQAFPVGKLSEGHAEVLVPAGKADHFVVAAVSIDTFSELVCRDKIHQLGKDGFPGIHAMPPHSLMRETDTSEKNISNR